MAEPAENSRAEPAGEGQGPNRLRSVIILLSFVLPALALLLLLGTWQVHRLQWKEGLIATIESRMEQAPVTLDTALATWRQEGDVDYLPVRFAGTFENDREQHFLATHNGQSGWYVYAPVALSDDRTVIVNRGFVPYDLKEPAGRPWAPVEGAVEIVGLARNPLAEKPGSLVPDNASEDSIWYWKDFSAMADAMGLDDASLVPFFVDVSTTDGKVDAGPVGGVTRVSLPNNHLQYAVTWFGLAGALVVVTGFFLRRLLRKS